MEAFSAGKCVITTTDAGGVLEIVRQGETGFVSDAAAAIYRQKYLPGLARTGTWRLSWAARPKRCSLPRELSWQNTVARLAKRMNKASLLPEPYFPYVHMLEERMPRLRFDMVIDNAIRDVQAWRRISHLDDGKQATCSPTATPSSSIQSVCVVCCGH